MRNIELGPVRPVGAVDVSTAHQARENGKGPKPSEAPEAAVVKSDALNPGQAPIDTERVAQIRKAVESGQYPLVPTKIADAMIAAGMLLRTGK